MNKYCISLSGVCVLLSLATAEAKQRDPFQPYAWNYTAAKEENQATAMPENTYSLNPLEMNSVNAYGLIGLIISQNKSVAVVKSPEGKEFFVKPGDALGKEGGHIESFNTDGITINSGSSLITIPVSNKIEVVTDDKAKKPQ